MRYADHCEEMDDMEREAEANINHRNREIRELKTRIAELEKALGKAEDLALFAVRHPLDAFKAALSGGSNDADILRALREAKGE